MVDPCWKISNRQSRDLERQYFQRYPPPGASYVGSVPVFIDDRCEGRCGNGGAPCAGITPGGTPSYMSVSPMSAVRREFRRTGRLPHGKLRKPDDPCCRFSSSARWPENLPWRPSPLCCAAQPCQCASNCNAGALGCIGPRTTFRNYSLCGVLREFGSTKNACSDPCSPNACSLFQMHPCGPKGKKAKKCRSDDTSATESDWEWISELSTESEQEHLHTRKWSTLDESVGSGPGDASGGSFSGENDKAQNDSSENGGCGSRKRRCAKGTYKCVSEEKDSLAYTYCNEIDCLCAKNAALARRRSAFRPTQSLLTNPTLRRDAHSESLKRNLHPNLSRAQSATASSVSSFSGVLVGGEVTRRTNRKFNCTGKGAVQNYTRVGRAKEWQTRVARQPRSLNAHFVGDESEFCDTIMCCVAGGGPKWLEPAICSLPITTRNVNSLTSSVNI